LRLVPMTRRNSAVRGTCPYQQPSGDFAQPKEQAEVCNVVVSWTINLALLNP
jgi:hypothetical protein